MHTGDFSEVRWCLEAVVDVIVLGIETTGLVAWMRIVAWSDRAPRSAASMRIAECVDVRSL